MVRNFALLVMAVALAACELFGEDTGGDSNAQGSSGDEETPEDGDPTGDGQDDVAADQADDNANGSGSTSPARDGGGAARDGGPARDGGGAPRLDAGLPPSIDPPRTIDGGPPLGSPEAGFRWAMDAATVIMRDASASLSDGGLIKFDPDASGPVLNPQAQTACIGLLNNICNRSADCEVSVLGLDASMRTRVFESCRNSLWRARNCNRATSTASGFAQCSESTKTLSCVSVLSTDLSTSCANQITLQP